MNLSSGIPGLLRPVAEQTPGTTGTGLLASQGPSGNYAASGGAGFLSYLQPQQQSTPPAVPQPETRPEAYDTGRPDREPDYQRESRDRFQDQDRAASANDRPAASESTPDRSRSERADRDQERNQSDTDSKKPRDENKPVGERKSATENRAADNETKAPDQKAEGTSERKVEGQEKRVADDSTSDKQKRTAAKSTGENSLMDGVPGTQQNSLASAAAELTADIKNTILLKGEADAGQSKKDHVLLKAEGQMQGDAKAGGVAVATQSGTADAAEIAKFAERVAAAKSELRKGDAGAEGRSGENNNDKSNHAKNAKEGLESAGSGLRVELDSAKWQLNGRVYGERGGQDTTESKLAGLMDRYVRSGKSDAKGSGNKEGGSESGQENRGDARSFANRLNELGGMGDVRDASARGTQEMTGQQKEEVARENRRLFNDLVEKARVNVQSNGNSTASIRMNPAALGRMTLNLEVNQNQVHARIVVESDAAKRMVMDEMDHLRQELTRQGITVESLSIRVREPASMSFMEQGSGADEQSTQEQPATGEDNSSDGSGNDASGDQSMRTSGEQAGQEYDLASSSSANAERNPRELSAVNISI